MKLEVLYEDEYMIAVVKPPGVPSQGDRSNDTDMVSHVKDYLFDHSDSDDEPYVAMINRLDRPVGGIMLFAKNEDMAAKLTDMIQLKAESENGIKKYYQAILTGYLEEEEGTFTDYLLFDKKNNISKVVPENTPGAKKAVLKYELIDEFETDSGYLTYVLINLLTGRHHQIRCQMAAHGAPVYGDIRYNESTPKKGQVKDKNHKKRGGGAVKASKEIALFSSRMEFMHPVTGEKIVLRKEPDTAAFEAIELDEF